MIAQPANANESIGLRELQYEQYDEWKLLQAMQAAVIYGLLCSQSPGGLSSDNSFLVVTTIEVGYLLHRPSYRLTIHGVYADVREETFQHC